jgi:ketosteroid isomerase-like protein
MKKICIILSIALMVIAACQQIPKTVPVDMEAEKAAVNDLFEKFNSAINNQDVTTMASCLSEDALLLGSDPSEFWNKQQFTDLWAQMLADTVPEVNYISEREIKLAPDGNSAIVVEQYMWPYFTPKIAWRNVYHMVKNDDQWMIYFFSCALIPKNEDFQKLNEAME